MYKTTWYTRDGYLDMFPMIADKLRESGFDYTAYDVCHHKLEKEHLRKVYGVDDNISVLAEYIKEYWNRGEAAQILGASRHHHPPSPRLVSGQAGGPLRRSFSEASEMRRAP